jgi:putative oxidoreductase
MATERRRIRRGLLERLGALLAAGIFVHGGWTAFRDPAGRAKKAAKLGLPQPELMVKVNGLTMIGTGLALGLGWKPKLSALVLAGSLVPTTLAGHRFWEEQTADGRSTQLTQFLKNLAMLGGLLFLVSKRRSVKVPAAAG